MGWLLGGADKRERDGTGEGDAIPPRTAVRIPPAFPALPKPERTNSQSLRAAVMPQDRRSPPSDDSTHQPTADCAAAQRHPQPQRLSGWVLRSQQFPAVSAPESDRGRGNPAHVRPSSRPERQNQDAAGRSSPPRSGIHTAVSSGRGSAAVLLAPCSAPTATCALARERSSPRRARTLPPFSIPWRQPKPTPPQH